eukprot:1318619-Amorphochlora_amoeboformis.AAC.1
MDAEAQLKHLEEKRKRELQNLEYNERQRAVAARERNYDRMVEALVPTSATSSRPARRGRPGFRSHTISRAVTTVTSPSRGTSASAPTQPHVPTRRRSRRLSRSHNRAQSGADDNMSQDDSGVSSRSRRSSTEEKKTPVSPFVLPRSVRLPIDPDQDNDRNLHPMPLLDLPSVVGGVGVTIVGRESLDAPAIAHNAPSPVGPSPQPPSLSLEHPAMTNPECHTTTTILPATNSNLNTDSKDLETERKAGGGSLDVYGQASSTREGRGALQQGFLEVKRRVGSTASEAPLSSRRRRGRIGSSRSSRARRRELQRQDRKASNVSEASVQSVLSKVSTAPVAIAHSQDSELSEPVVESISTPTTPAPPSHVHPITKAPAAIHSPSPVAVSDSNPNQYPNLNRNNPGRVALSRIPPGRRMSEEDFGPPPSTPPPPPVTDTQTTDQSISEQDGKPVAYATQRREVHVNAEDVEVDADDEWVSQCLGSGRDVA